MSEPRSERLRGEEAVDRILAEVAAAVADRTPVDWEREQSRTPAPARAALDNLRRIAAIHEAHARLVTDPGPAAGVGWGPLRVLERIGAGSFAEVHRAYDPSLQREVALKLRRADAGPSHLDDRRWIEEARRLARVRHPHVLTIHGADVHDGRAGLWTELLAGETLEDGIAARGALGPREAVAVGLDLCAALAAVHGAGLVHGDLTTRNVMRVGSAAASGGSGRIVLMDFGSVHDRAHPGLIAFGTPLFTAPEVLDGAEPTPRSDVYSLGVVLYRLLTARYPVEPASAARIREQLLSDARMALREARPDLPPALVQAVERAASPHPERRFATAAELEQALAEALPAARSRRPRPVAWVAAAAGLALAVAAGLWFAPRRAPVTGGAEPAPPPAPVAAPVAPAPAAGPAVMPALRVEAALHRVTAGSREALASGDLVAPGDALGLEIEASAPVHVYVLNEDQQGRVHALFPLRGRGAGNPLAAGVRHRLPGAEAGRTLDWQVTSAGGRETILILAAREPLAPVEQAIAAIPEARPGAPVTYAPLAPAALARLRGVGGVAVGRPLQEARARGILHGLANHLSTQGGGFWMRLIELENPAP